MSFTDWLRLLTGSSIFTGAFIFIARQFDWIRFNKKDKVQVKKVESEIGIDVATVNSKRVEDEINISKVALEWTVQLADQLEKSNTLNERRQVEIERLHSIIDKMKDDFNTQIEKLENELDAAKQDCEKEKAKNIQMQEQLKKYLNDNQ